VRVIDEEVPALQMLEHRVGQKLYTAVNQPDIVAECVAWADVLIGAAHIAGHRAPVVVTEDMVDSMRDGSVVIDVAIDQGGCIETSRLTDHKSPTFKHNGVIHYCVPNIASRVARTGSLAVSNILAPMLLKLGKNGGVKGSLGRSASIRSGIYVYHKHITQRSLASMFGLNYMDIDLLYAADI
jgi:alanine dehydrogenase